MSDPIDGEQPSWQKKLLSYLRAIDAPVKLLLAVGGFIATICFGAWQVWQFAYQAGQDKYREQVSLYLRQVGELREEVSKKNLQISMLELNSKTGVYETALCDAKINICETNIKRTWNACAEDPSGRYGKGMLVCRVQEGGAAMLVDGIHVGVRRRGISAVTATITRGALSNESEHLVHSCRSFFDDSGRECQLFLDTLEDQDRLVKFVLSCPPSPKICR